MTEATICSGVGRLRAHAEDPRVSNLDDSSGRLAAAVAPVSFAAQFQFATGAEYSAARMARPLPTEALVVPLSVKLSGWRRFSLRASVPYVGVRGPADHRTGHRRQRRQWLNSGSGSAAAAAAARAAATAVMTAAAAAAAVDDDTQSTSRQSRYAGPGRCHDLGHLVVRRPVASTPLYLDVTGRVRLPTGSTAKGLGTGTTDYAALAEIGWDGNTGGVFVSGGRRLLESTATASRAWMAGRPAPATGATSASDRCSACRATGAAAPLPGRRGSAVRSMPS